MIKKMGIALGLSVLSTSAAIAAVCEEDEYIVGIDSTRSDNSNGWAIWVSPKPYFDSAASNYPSDLGSSAFGGRLDLNKSRGRFIFSMAMNAMNMGYKIKLSDIYGTQLCDDFQNLEVEGKL